MNTLQRYKLQKHSILNDLGYDYYDKSFVPSLFDNYIDRYIVSTIETRDKRRLLLDKAEYTNILDAFEKDANKRIEKAITDICKEFN